MPGERPYWWYPKTQEEISSISNSTNNTPDWYEPLTDEIPIDRQNGLNIPSWAYDMNPIIADDSLNRLSNFSSPFPSPINKYKGTKLNYQNDLGATGVYTSYAGTDITASIIIPGESGPLDIGELQTISYSIHRENTPVRSLGRVGPRGFVKGPRTIAGSLIFTQFDLYAFYKLKTYADHLTAGLYPLSDMLPPFDVTISFSNEMGSFSKLRIYGITIVDEGSTMSVDDLITEQTFTYMARGIQPMINYVPDEISGISSNSEVISPTRNILKVQ